MASILIHTADESVTLTAQTVKRLLDRGDGDAALLYLALLRHHGTGAAPVFGGRAAMGKEPHRGGGASPAGPAAVGARSGGDPGAC
ncbi:MAG: hypothetical protein V8R21_07465 [Dysosmobacter sp.]